MFDKKLYSEIYIIEIPTSGSKINIIIKMLIKINDRTIKSDKIVTKELFIIN